MQGEGRRARWSWAFYDWANSAFATTVMAGFFPVFFKQFWADGLSATDSTFWLGLGNSVAAVLVVLLAPLLGALSDRHRAKKRLLLGFAGLGIVSTGGLFLVAQGAWPIALAMYLLAVIGFSASNVTYDALLPGVAGANRLERLSALGFALGYLGGGLLFLLNVVMVLYPESFGLADKGAAVRLSFILVAAWWAVFSLPLLLYVSEPPAGAPSGTEGVSSLRDVMLTLRELRRLPAAFTFLVAYWCYIDGVDTIVRMAVDYGLALGMQTDSLLAALLITQFVGFPAALAFGAFGQRLGAKRGIWIALVVYVLVVFWAWRMQTAAEFYALAVAIGLVQGGIQALSRALFAQLVPAEQAGRFFGLYNMMGKFAVFLGPLMVGWVGVLTGNPRAGILSILALFLAGAWLLSRVDVAAGRAAAARFAER